MPTFQTPGGHRAEVFPSPTVALRTSVPLFLGLTADGPRESPERLTLWGQLGERFAGSATAGFLADAVRGFFANGREVCHVVRLDDTVGPVEALRAGLAAGAQLDAVDHVGLPDATPLRPPGAPP